ncbi:hypothetical protein [Dysgonomonas sp. 25]|uniref:XAC2610-related protein n=1 Tax=Dysgonomonas sp. 25 TaxID=2302933 RepID=UPI0013D24F6E|nr:hypothetical protein [Dysgonomonas sp. 25]
MAGKEQEKPDLLPTPLPAVEAEEKEAVPQVSDAQLKEMCVIYDYVLTGKIGDEELIMSVSINKKDSLSKITYRNRHTRFSPHIYRGMSGKFVENRLNLFGKEVINRDSVEKTRIEAVIDLEKGTLSGKKIWKHGKEELIEMQHFYDTTVPLFTFKSDYTDKGFNTDSLTKIVIYDLSDNVVQEIAGLDARPSSNTIHLSDINFDGYPDIALDMQWLARGGIYRYWLYNKDSQQFEETDIMDGILSERSTDYLNQTITVSEMIDENVEETRVYKYINGKYELIDSYTITFEEE